MSYNSMVRGRVFFRAASRSGRIFANIDHAILLGIIGRHVDNADVLWLLTEVIESFHTDGKPGIGLPLGNLTSQPLVNIYMNVFDHFVKRKLKVAYYIRYADDFVILHERKEYLEGLLPRVALFLHDSLRLTLRLDKVFITTMASGVDFLGWVHFLHLITPPGAENDD